MDKKNDEDKKPKRKRIKKRNTGENALKRFFPGNFLDLHRTQGVLFKIVDPSGVAAVGKAWESIGKRRSDVVKLKRSVLQWMEIPEPIRLALRNMKTEEFIAIGCCAVDAVLNRTDPSRAFVVARTELSAKGQWNVVAIYEPPPSSIIVDPVLVSAEVIKVFLADIAVKKTHLDSRSHATQAISMLEDEDGDDMADEIEVAVSSQANSQPSVIGTVISPSSSSLATTSPSTTSAPSAVPLVKGPSVKRADEGIRLSVLGPSTSETCLKAPNLHQRLMPPPPVFVQDMSSVFDTNASASSAVTVDDLKRVDGIRSHSLLGINHGTAQGGIANTDGAGFLQPTLSSNSLLPMDITSHPFIMPPQDPMDFGPLDSALDNDLEQSESIPLDSVLFGHSSQQHFLEHGHSATRSLSPVDCVDPMFIRESSLSDGALDGSPLLEPSPNARKWLSPSDMKRKPSQFGKKSDAEDSNNLLDPSSAATMNRDSSQYSPLHEHRRNISSPTSPMVVPCSPRFCLHERERIMAESIWSATFCDDDTCSWPDFKQFIKDGGAPSEMDDILQPFFCDAAKPNIVKKSRWVMFVLLFHTKAWIDDPRPSLSIDEAVDWTKNWAFYGVKDRSSANTLLRNDIQQDCSCLFRTSESSWGFVVLSRKNYTLQPNCYWHTLFGRHRPGETVLVTTLGKHGSARDMEVDECEIDKEFFYEPANPYEKRFINLREILEAKSSSEGYRYVPMFESSAQYIDIDSTQDGT